MPENTENTQAQTTPDAAANNTGADTSGAATQTATTEATQEKTFTQAEVDSIIQKRLAKAVKAELKKMGSDETDAPNVEELQRQLQDAQKQTRTFEARESIRDFLSDPKNQLPVKSQDMAGAVALITQHLEFDDEGKILNLKQAVDKAKTLAPSLFAQASGHINQGSTKTAAPNDMNAFIRQQHAAKYN